MTTKRLLFPISLNNNIFSTERVLFGLNTIPEYYDELVFIIADQIQLYNRSFSVCNGNSFDETIKKFYSGRTLFEQRSTWLSKLKNEFGSSNNFPVWTIYGFDDIADQMFTRIYRNIIIMYHTIPEFKKDIDNEALNHVSSYSGTANITDVNTKLSVSYIIEELAASVRLHVYEDISDEYYLGKQLNSVLKLYYSDYGTTVFSIAGVESKPIKWRFFESNPDLKSPKWIERTLSV